MNPQNPSSQSQSATSTQTQYLPPSQPQYQPYPQEYPPQYYPDPAPAPAPQQTYQQPSTYYYYPPPPPQPPLGKTYQQPSTYHPPPAPEQQTYQQPSSYYYPPPPPPPQPQLVDRVNQSDPLLEGSGGRSTNNTRERKWGNFLEVHMVEIQNGRDVKQGLMNFMRDYYSGGNVGIIIFGADGYVGDLNIMSPEGQLVDLVSPSLLLFMSGIIFKNSYFSDIKVRVCSTEQDGGGERDVVFGSVVGPLVAHGTVKVLLGMFRNEISVSAA